MILDLAKKHPIDLKNSYMVGDKVIDAECGKNAGIPGIMVRAKQVEAHPYFKTLLDFANHLKSKE